MLHVSEPYISPKASEYVQDCINKNWFSWRGEYVEKFEEEFAKEVGASYAVMVSSGTAALEIAYSIARKFTSNTKLTLPNFSFIATLSSALRAGYKTIEIAGINKVDLGINMYSKWRNTAVCIVPISGLINWERFSPYSTETFVIIDAAQALGTKIDYQKYDIGTYSFFANKFISTGEGGMLVTNNPNIAKTAQELRSLPSFEYLETTSYSIDLPQTNYRPTNIAAALGLAQLETLEEKLVSHDTVYTAYKNLIHHNGFSIQQQFQSQGFTQFPWVTRFIIDQNYFANHYSVSKEIINLLKNKDIEAKPLYTPFTAHPLAHRYIPYNIIKNAIAEDTWGHNIQGFYLPTHQNVTIENVQKIAKIINDY